MIGSTRGGGVGLVCVVIALAACQAPSKTDPVVPEVPHDNFFVVTGSHAGYACSECHDPAMGTFSLAGGGVDCLRCHTNAEASPMHAGVTGYSWATGACIACHKGGGAAVDHSALFPITSGTTHGAVGCLQCHGASKAVADLQCTACHGHHDQAQMNANHQGLQGYSFSSQACYGCHQDGSLPAFDHAFPIGAGSAHANNTCADCHGATNAIADLRCAACHDHAKPAMDAAHGSLAGYSFTSAACYNCHQDSTIPSFDHSFPIAAGTTHAPPMACTDCHGATKAVADLLCTTCHDHAKPAMDAAHGHMTGYAYTNTACFNCHKDGKLPAFNHSFPITAGTTHAPPMACTDCHGATRAVADLRCTACHNHDQASMAAVHGSLSGYSWTSTACYNCHQDGGLPPFNHSFPIAAGTTHAPPIACMDCHGATRAVADLRCISCHDHAQPATDGAHSGLAGYTYTSPACFNCHQDGSVPPFAHAFPITAGTTHGPPITCADCHGATRAVADLRCTSCHAQAATATIHASVTGYAYNSPACYNCHQAGDSFLPANHDTADFPVTGSLHHGGLSCSQCHGATKSVADLTCTSCHTQAATATQHAAIPASTRGRQDGVTRINYQWSSDYCLKCHADDQVQTIATHPRVSNGITGGDHHPFCLTCHQTATTSGKTWAVNFSQYTCLACHSSNNPD